MMHNQVFIIGAQRCGTTFLYKLLDAHPQIALAKPIRPEPKHFLNVEEYNQGRVFYESKYFSMLDHQVKVIGEKATSYIEYPDVAKRIKDYYPGAKVLLVLRNPVDRAISNYLFSKENGLETRTAEEVFLENCPPPELSKSVSVNPFEYLKRGQYMEYIPHFWSEFGENMKIILFEELFLLPQTYIEICRFLSVDPDLAGVPEKGKINESKSELETVKLNEIRAKLAAHYQPYNEDLEAFLGRKTNWL
ncbi:MAG: sulfotransferase [Flavobacteriales bacterium]|nr:sulfotransferase [Flavobacteriales bacterium]